MPTANTFTPIVGSLDAPFAIVSDDGTTIPRSAVAGATGDPRPGVLRWVLLLSTPDASFAGDDSFFITVPFPEDFKLDVNTIASTFPSLSLVAASAIIANLFTSGAEVSGFDIANRTLTVRLLVSSVVQAGEWLLTIDFCHSAVN